VILIDANLLLYAHDQASALHVPAARWLERTFEEEPDVRLALVTLLAFVRLATDPRLFLEPMTSDEAFTIVAGWLVLPNVGVAQPTERHWPLFREMSAEGKVRGAQLMDAHLAALSLEYGATLATSDRGFARYPRLRWIDPLAGA